MYNSIVYSNQYGNLSMPHTVFPYTNQAYYSCFTPADPANLQPDPSNITDEPRFANFAGDDYRLTAGSPCVNTGSNDTWMATAVDLDGKRRLDWSYNKVDRGAYEYPFAGSIMMIR
jgi:hypothetical protein